MVRENKIVRAFLGIPFPICKQKLIKSISRKIQKNFNQVEFNFCELKNLHITLKFIAQFSLSDTLILISKLQQQLKQFPSFVINLGKLQLLPNNVKPAVVVLEVISNEIIELHQQVEAIFTKLRYPIEPRKFKPHITLARLKNGILDPNILSKTIDFARPQIKINSIDLFESRPSPDGSVYIPLANIKLS